MTVEEYHKMMKVGEIADKYNIHVATDNNMFLVIDKDDNVLYTCETIEVAFGFIEGCVSTIQRDSQVNVEEKK
jgi:hypothetical protein